MRKGKIKSAFHNILWDFRLAPEKTALILVDLQYGDAHPDYGYVGGCRRLGGKVAHDLDYYIDRLENYVVPNSKRLLEAFRKLNAKVIHLQWGYRSPDSSDLAPTLNWLADKAGLRPMYPGTKEFSIRTEVAPLDRDGEIILLKTTCGAFNSSPIDPILKAWKITHLVVVGVVTAKCVYATAQGAYDYGYFPTVVEDAVADTNPEAHEMFLKWGGYFHIKSTDEVIKELRARARKPARARQKVA